MKCPPQLNRWGGKAGFKGTGVYVHPKRTRQHNPLCEMTHISVTSNQPLCLRNNSQVLLVIANTVMSHEPTRRPLSVVTLSLSLAGSCT